MFVAKSNIAGQGVFASRSFKKGEVVIIWQPKIITENEFQSLPEAEKHFIYGVEGQYIYMQTPEKYVNHSCNSNTKTDGLKDIAVRDIKKSEEITADYNSDGVITFRCSCGTENCRGLVS